MKHTHKGISIGIWLLSLIACILPAAAKTDKEGEKGRDVRKADYLFLEGTRQNQLGNADAYFDLLRMAHDLNPNDRFIGKEYGFNLMRISDDSSKVAEGYKLIEDYIGENQGDFYANVLFAALSSRLGKHDKSISTWERLHENQPERPEITIRYAEALTASGKENNLNKALALYDEIESAEGISIQLTSDRLRLNMMRGDTASVLNDVRRLLASSPLSVDYNIFAGDIYSHLGHGDSAIMFYDKAVELDPSDGAAYYSRAMYYKSVGDSAAYDREVFRALEQESLDVEPKIEILRGYTVEFYTDSIQQPRIKSMFDRLIELHPHEVEIHLLYRDFLYAIKDYAGAAEQASYALDIDPSEEGQWLALASLYMQTGEPEKAYEASMRGIHFHPSNGLLYFLGGNALIQSGNYDDAMEMMNEALSLTDEDDYEEQSNIYTSIGDIFYNTANTDSAFVYYNKAIELNPDNMTALNNCAYYLACEDKNLDEALEMIEKVVEARPEEATSLDTYAWVLFKRKDYEGAKNAIEDALDYAASPSAELYEHAGDIYFMLREPGKALEMWEKALELEPDNELLKRKVKYKTYFYE